MAVQPEWMMYEIYGDPDEPISESSDGMGTGGWVTFHIISFVLIVIIFNYISDRVGNFRREYWKYRISNKAAIKEALNDLYFWKDVFLCGLCLLGATMIIWFNIDMFIANFL